MTESPSKERPNFFIELLSLLWIFFIHLFDL